MFDVGVEFSPVHELWVSLSAYIASANHKTLDAGVQWARRVKDQLGNDFSRTLSASCARKSSAAPFIEGLIFGCPSAAKQSIESFLDWLSKLQVGQIFECLHALDIQNLPTGPLDGLRDEWVRLLTEWNEGYFRHLNPEILDGLTAQAERMRNLAASLAPEEAVLQASQGLRFGDHMGVERVLLIPQYHYRPWNMTVKFNHLLVVMYPVDVVPPKAEEIPPHLLRLVKALGDESRLRILRFIAQRETCTFTDVVQFSGLTKGTVHHHLVALRAAGLVVLEADKHLNWRYALNLGTIEALSDLVKSYVLNPV